MRNSHQLNKKNILDFSHIELFPHKTNGTLHNSYKKVFFDSVVAKIWEFTPTKAL